MRLGKEGRDEAYQSRPAAGKRLKVLGAERCRCLFQHCDSASVETLSADRRQAASIVYLAAAANCSPARALRPLTTPVRSPPPLGAADESPPWVLLSFRDALQLKRPNPR